MQTAMLVANVIFFLCGLVQGVTPDTESNRVWPADASETQKNLEINTKAVCGRIPYRKPEELLRGGEYPVTELNKLPGGEGSLLASIVSSRLDFTDASFTRTQELCGLDRHGVANPEANCDEAWVSYFNGLFLPFAVPLIAAVVVMMLHTVCCFVGLCRCCRQMVLLQRGQRAFGHTSTIRSAGPGLVDWCERHTGCTLLITGGGQPKLAQRRGLESVRGAHLYRGDPLRRRLVPRNTAGAGTFHEGIIFAGC